MYGLTPIAGALTGFPAASVGLLCLPGRLFALPTFQDGIHVCGIPASVDQGLPGVIKPGLPPFRQFAFSPFHQGFAGIRSIDDRDDGFRLSRCGALLSADLLELLIGEVEVLPMGFMDIREGHFHPGRRLLLTVFSADFLTDSIFPVLGIDQGIGTLDRLDFLTWSRRRGAA